MTKKEKIYEWIVDADIMIAYTPHEPYDDTALTGFDAVVYEFISCELGIDYGDIENWKTELVETQVMYKIIAYWDGVRHVNLDEGYLNYPIADTQIAIWTRLKELEREFCREWD